MRLAADVLVVVSGRRPPWAVRNMLHVRIIDDGSVGPVG
jgi:hypothetical protein